MSDLETRVIALDMLWIALADKFCRLSRLSSVEMGEVLSEEFNEARLDMGSTLTQHERAAMKHAAKVALRLTRTPDEPIE